MPNHLGTGTHSDHEEELQDASGDGLSTETRELFPNPGTTNQAIRQGGHKLRNIQLVSIYASTIRNCDSSKQ